MTFNLSEADRLVELRLFQKRRLETALRELVKQRRLADEALGKLQPSIALRKIEAQLRLLRPLAAKGER